MSKTLYTEDSIRSLDWREHIRMRPGMYIGKQGDGSSRDDGIYILVKEIVDNSVDEYVMGYGKKIDRVGVLWLKSKSRGEDKKGKRLKGKNWEVYESPRTQEENIEIFNHVKALFDIENPKPTPYTQTFTTTSKRKV